MKEDREVIPILRSLLTDNPPSPGKVTHTTGVYVHSLVSNSYVDSFPSHNNQISESVVRRDPRFFVLIREDQKSNRLQMSLQRQHS